MLLARCLAKFFCVCSFVNDVVDVVSGVVSVILNATFIKKIIILVHSRYNILNYAHQNIKKENSFFLPSSNFPATLAMSKYDCKALGSSATKNYYKMTSE